MTTPRLLLTLALLATSLALAASPATARQTITLSIPYALLVHADAYTTETIELEDATYLVIEARAPLSIYLHTNDNWELTVRTQSGHARTLAGSHGYYTLTSADLDDLPVTDGEYVTISVERRPRGGQN